MTQYEREIKENRKISYSTILERLSNVDFAIGIKDGEVEILLDREPQSQLFKTRGKYDQNDFILLILRLFKQNTGIDFFDEVSENELLSLLENFVRKYSKVAA